MLSARQSKTPVLGQFLSARQSLTSSGRFLSRRQSLTPVSRTVVSARRSLTPHWPEAFAALTTPGEMTVSTFVAAGWNVWDAPEFSASFCGLDVSQLLGDLSITMPLNGKSSATVTLANPVDDHGVEVEPSDLAPPGYGAYAGLVRQHNGTTLRNFRFGIRSAGTSWSSETYLPGPTGFAKRLKPWTCDDLTATIESDTGNYLDDIVMAAGDRVMAHSAARQVATLAGFPIDLRYPNYLIGEHRRGSGSPLSWLDALARPMQAARRWERGVLIYEQVRTDAPASWDFVEDLNISTLDLDEFPRQPNSFVFVRFTPGGGYIGEGSGREVGRVRVSFDPSRNVVVDVVKVIQGRFDNWVFFAENGTPLTGSLSNGIYSGPIPAAYAEATYIPLIGTAAYEPGWECLARGGPIQREGNYRFTADDPLLQSIYSVVTAGKAIAEPGIGDEAGAATATQAWLAEAKRKVWIAKFATPFLNPWIRPGQIIRVKDRYARQNWTRWVVERVQINKRGPHGSMQLECTRGEQ